MASPIKKTLKHPKADANERRIFQEKIAAYEAAGRAIVYIDESGFAHDAPHTHGYAPAGQRCHGTHDWHAQGRINAIGALIEKLLLSVSLFAVNISADVFHGWARQDLLPKLPSHAVVVMDNAAFHKRQDIRARPYKTLGTPLNTYPLILLI